MQRAAESTSASHPSVGVVMDEPWPRIGPFLARSASTDCFAVAPGTDAHPPDGFGRGVGTSSNAPSVQSGAPSQRSSANCPDCGNDSAFDPRPDRVVGTFRSRRGCHVCRPAPPGYRPRYIFGRIDGRICPKKIGLLWPQSNPFRGHPLRLGVCFSRRCARPARARLLLRHGGEDAPLGHAGWDPTFVRGRGRGSQHYAAVALFFSDIVRRYGEENAGTPHRIDTLSGAVSGSPVSPRPASGRG